MFDSFEKYQVTLRVFIDLSKVFDTVDNSILLKKFYGITDNNRKHYIHISKISKTDFKYLTCSVPQGFILGPLLFLVYFNDIPCASRILTLIWVGSLGVYFEVGGKITHPLSKTR